MKSKKKIKNVIPKIESASNALNIGDNLKCETEMNSIQPSENDSLGWYKLQKLKGSLEYKELNLDSAKYCLNRALTNTTSTMEVKTRLANIEMLKGNYRQALDHLNGAKSSNGIVENIKVDKTLYYIRRGDFETALETILEINYNNLSVKYLKIYKFLIQHIHSKLKIPMPILSDLSKVLDYRFSVSQDDTGEVTMEHVRKHFSSESDVNSKFLPNISYLDLIKKFKEQKDLRKPLISLDTDIYNVEYDETVATVNGLPTNHFKVVTLLNSCKVISVYPFLPSYSYDVENYKTLTKKRKK